jgi:hypothetical protein
MIIPLRRLAAAVAAMERQQKAEGKPRVVPQRPIDDLTSRIWIVN